MKIVHILLLLLTLAHSSVIQCMHAAQTKSPHTSARNTIIFVGAAVGTVITSLMLYRKVIKPYYAKQRAQQQQHEAEQKRIAEIKLKQENEAREKALQEKTAFYAQLEEKIKKWVSNECPPDGFSTDSREITHYMNAAYKYLSKLLDGTDNGNIESYRIQAHRLISYRKAIRAKYENVRIEMTASEQEKFTNAHQRLVYFDAQVCTHGLSAIAHFIEIALPAEGANPETVKTEALNYLDYLCADTALYNQFKPRVEQFFEDERKKLLSRVAAS